MLLSLLLPGTTRTGPDIEITGITRDSREVQKGFLFAALAGNAEDGTRFISDALNKGAVAILTHDAATLPAGVSAIIHPEPRKALSAIAAAFYSAQPAMIAAVTGTSGKTSTVQFARQIWQACGHKSASIGTLGVIGDGIERYGSLTTPDSVALHADLSILARDLKITHVALEASSHGLNQYRLDGVKVRVAAFTNLSHDHLDYHATMEEYLDAKMRLFTAILAQDGTAVLNRDVPEYQKIADAVTARGIKILSFGTHEADVLLLKKQYEADGQELSIRYKDKDYDTRINLVGAFQSANVMCAAAIAIAGGESPDAVMAALPKLQGVRGRLEKVGAYHGGTVYVDYAHKPDALQNLLQALRPHTDKRLITVFGCGGNRDAGKRPIMGSIAAKLSDVVIVTDDNPRMEDTALIRKAVMEGCPGASEIGDRHAAIAHALSIMQTGDVVVIAGKGHEQGQIVGKETKPFDDVDVARSLMQEKAA